MNTLFKLGDALLNDASLFYYAGKPHIKTNYIDYLQKVYKLVVCLIFYIAIYNRDNNIL